MNNPIDSEIKTLPRNLRNLLEHRVQEARDIAETAARAAINQLGVGEAAPYPYLSDNQRSLRKRLRAHGRQLGDVRNASAHIQEIDLLVEEVAYQHWHRMLFARFLAENQLLMYPDPVQPVAVSLEECQELAEDEGARNGWELAARFAASMLPQIFRPDSPVFELDLPPEHQQRLEQLLNDLPVDIFTASDSLGWVYQFWQAKRKQEINDAGIKIGSRELPAVTQLFTEDYMVSFLLDNSIGAWWAGQRLGQAQLQNAASEEKLRSLLSLPGMPLKYLRFIKDEKGNWTPAAGIFSSWPKKLSEFKLLDPCCGSGHFLVAALLMLVPIRIEMEGLTAQKAIDVVLSENLHGLEIDQRCVELAAFNLALNAWRYPEAGGYRPLPELNLACIGLSLSASREEWEQMGRDNKNLRIALNWMYDLFQDAPMLGSLLNPAHLVANTTVNWEKLAAHLNTLLAREEEEQQQEMGVVARGLAQAAQLLAEKYQLVATNVPYLARGKQSEKLRDHCEKYYKEAKNDIATVFLERCLELSVPQGTVSVVLPQNWLFLTTYKKLREKLLKQNTWNFIARLGAHGFQTPMWDFNVQLFIISQGKASVENLGIFNNIKTPNQLISGLDVSNLNTPAEKADWLENAEIQQVEQEWQLYNPDARITFKDEIQTNLLLQYADSYQGISPADFLRYGRFFWENPMNVEWCFWQSTVSYTQEYGGRELILWINKVKLKAMIEKTAYIRGEEAWGKKSVVISAMRNLPVTMGSGEASDTNVAVIVPHNTVHLPAIWCFCSSPEYNEAVRQIDQSLKVTNATLVKVPFDLEYWQQVAAEKYPQGLPKPYSDDPTQWIFHGYPAKSEQPLQVAVARLLGYQWPAELDEEMELADEARKLIEKSNALLSHANKDGIVCIPAVGGEAPAAERLLSLLAAAYGEEWSKDMLSSLLANNDHAGKTLETWLRDKFFIQHCQLFHHRPFIWQIWDGLRDGFSVLVNYHHLDRKNLENLIYSYLGDWITRQKEDIRAGVDGAGEKLAAAESLKKRLELILEGEAPYDIFVRWKPIEEQPLGWEPDLNDGVRLNIRPFMSVPDVGKKGAGCLRDKPNIKWGKDRGKDVESAPWYHLFNGDRINDYHLSLAEKKDARMNW